jgi:hypothetical protein
MEARERSDDHTLAGAQANEETAPFPATDEWILALAMLAQPWYRMRAW